jgi:hypothetical protein
MGGNVDEFDDAARSIVIIVVRVPGCQQDNVVGLPQSISKFSPLGGSLVHFLQRAAILHGG